MQSSSMIVQILEFLGIAQRRQDAHPIISCNEFKPLVPRLKGKYAGMWPF